ncbi:MAG: polysaccharide deacetylase family protein [Acidimicrobiia bacterium]|nr:polysaccharide deacetylase family protein [Acidimicrobiia bacterium]
MALSRRAFLAAAAATAAAGLAACSKSVHRVVGSATTAPGGGAPPLSTTTTQHTGPAQLVYHGPRDRQMVAFTFHGSGDPNLTLRMLDLTRSLSAPITVFAVGTWLQQYPDITRRILAAGNELENHTYTHPQLRGAGAATVSREVIGCRNVLSAQTGSPGTYFRPSGMEGNYPQVVMDQAGAAGYPVVCGFDVDPSDYLDPGAALVESRVRQGLQPGSIVSLHLGHTGTLTAFPTLVATARSKGLQPVLVRDLLA